MTDTNRRNMLRVGLTFVALPSSMLHLGCVPDQEKTSRNTEGSPDNHSTVNDKKADPIDKGNSMQIQYLEIVTTEVDAVCATYSQLHDVTFGDGDQNLGGARTAKLANGGMLGVRAPMRDTEAPVVRPYLLVQDIQAAVDAASKSGAEVALPPMELAGHGTCAIVIQGGIESGLWQL
jgi:predicted enzyme related to lactoylglutathione lyase